MPRAVHEAVGQVGTADDRAGDDEADADAGLREALDRVLEQNRFAEIGFGVRVPGRGVVLGIVADHQVGADDLARAVVWAAPRMRPVMPATRITTARAALEPGTSAKITSACFQAMCVRTPFHFCPGRAAALPFQKAQWAHLPWEVVGKKLVCLDFHLDRVEHFQRGGLAAAHQQHEMAAAAEDGEQA